MKSSQSISRRDHKIGGASTPNNMAKFKSSMEVSEGNLLSKPIDNADIKYVQSAIIK